MTQNAVSRLVYSFKADTTLFSIYIVPCESGYCCPVVTTLLKFVLLVLQGLLLVYVLELVGKVYQTGWQGPSPAPNHIKLVKDDAGEALDILSNLRAGTNNTQDE